MRSLRGLPCPLARQASCCAASCLWTPLDRGRGLSQPLLLLLMRRLMMPKMLAAEASGSADAYRCCCRRCHRVETALSPYPQTMHRK